MALTSDQINAQNFADFYQKILPYLNGGGMGMKLLWENPNPTQSMSAGDISLSSSDYDMLIVMYRFTTSRNYIKSVVIPKSSTAYLDAGYFTSADNQVIYYRTLSSVDDLTVHIYNASKASNSSETMDNSVCIPYRIYGIKFYSYDNISCVMMSSTWEAGQTTVEFTDPIIDGDSIFDVYLPSQYADLIYSSLSVSGHTLTITFPSVQASDIEVKLRVNRG